ncbi:MAG TPA: hypothetical protein VFF52_06535 [Isosphaeraceae bacterium]|nr:hypothetical protein [Isosphaeraceae bacterium]
MRSPLRFAGLALFLVLSTRADRALAADGPGIHRLDGFMVQGVFRKLDPEPLAHRLSLREIQEKGLDGRPVDIGEILGLMAWYERLPSRIEEPLAVRGKIRVALTPNSLGDEAYSACFVALTYNGLVLSGDSGELTLVRPETRPDLQRPKRLWDREHILSTRLFRLGYLNSDVILRHYRDAIGTKDGHAVLVPGSNVVIVADSDVALVKLGIFIDSQTLAAMGRRPRDRAGPAEGPPLPSAGATASREGIHFYLLAYARSNRIPLAATEQPGVVAKYYPEADLWTSHRGFQTLEQEYRRVSQAVRLAQEAAAQGWVDPHPERTLSPAAQGKLAIRFGLVTPLPERANPQATKKSARRR